MSYGEIPPRTSLRGYWKMENANDSSGNNRTLTVVSNVTFTSGRLGGLAADYGASGDGRGLGLTSNIFSADPMNTLTISFWYKLNVAGSTNPNARFWETGLAASHGIFLHSIASGNITIGGGFEQTLGGASVTFTMPADLKWHHVVFVRPTGNSAELYIDGALRHSVALGGGSNIGAAGTYRFAIGMSRSATACALAKIDEFIIEERAWTAQEIRKMYSYARGFFAV